MMKGGGANVVKMAEEGEETATQLVVPNLDFIVVTSGDKQRLLSMKAYSTNWTIVLVKLIDEGAHAVVP
jgi:hypothetical protein